MVADLRQLRPSPGGDAFLERCAGPAAGTIKVNKGFKLLLAV